MYRDKDYDFLTTSGSVSAAALFIPQEIDRRVQNFTWLDDRATASSIRHRRRPADRRSNTRRITSLYPKPTSSGCAPRD